MTDSKKKTRTYKLMTAILMAGSLMIGACSQAGNSQAKTADEGQNESSKITFTDDLGRTLSIEKPKRVAALIGSFADEWINAGGKDTLVAAAGDTWTSFDDNLNKKKVSDLGGVKDINAEVLTAAEPDFVIASAKNESQKDLLKTLDSMNIPVAYFEVSNFDDYLKTLKIFTDLTGDSKAYEEDGLKQQEEIEKTIASRKDKPTPKVLYIRAAGKKVLPKSSKGTILGEMLADLNTDNVSGNDDAALDSISMEQILKENPDAIFIVGQGSDEKKLEKMLDDALYSNPVWNELYAVQNEQVYHMDQRLYNLKPNALWAEAYGNLADILDALQLNSEESGS